MRKDWVNLGGSKERAVGPPTVFERLGQGADARFRQVEAAKEKALARKSTSIIPEVQAVDDPVSLTTPDSAYSDSPFQDRPRRGIRMPVKVVGTALTFTVAELLIATGCGGGGGDNNPTDTSPTRSADATRTIEPTGIGISSTPKVTESPTPEPLYGPAPVTAQFEADLNAAFAKADPQSILPQYTADAIRSDFRGCIGEKYNVDSVQSFTDKQNFAGQTLNACLANGQIAVQLYRESGLEEYLVLVADFRDTYVSHIKNFASQGLISVESASEGKITTVVENFFTP